MIIKYNKNKNVTKLPHDTLTFKYNIEKYSKKHKKQEPGKIYLM